MSGSTSVDKLDLTVDKAEAIIRQLTDGLVNIKDAGGEFAYDMPGGGKLDTKSWDQWEWTHGVALTGLYNVSPRVLLFLFLLCLLLLLFLPRP